MLILSGSVKEKCLKLTLHHVLLFSYSFCPPPLLVLHFVLSYSCPLIRPVLFVLLIFSSSCPSLPAVLLCSYLSCPPPVFLFLIFLLSSSCHPPPVLLFLLFISQNNKKTKVPFISVSFYTYLTFLLMFIWIK